MSLVQLKNGFFILRGIVRRKLGRLMQATPTLVSTDGVLERARTFLEKREIAAALEYYALAVEQDCSNLEAHIGTSICHIELGNWNAALKILQKADTIFGDHEAILGLITRCKLHEKAWDDLETYWSRWRKSYSQYPALNFYQTTGEILVSLLKSGSNSNVLLEKLLSDLVFQDDRSVNSESHPVICSLLFHWHEYDRPFYLLLRDTVKSFLSGQKAEYKKTTLCSVVMLLFVGLVSKEERRNLLRDHFREFALYSHWSFVLIGSSWNAVWDESIKNNTETIPIVREILQEEVARLNACEPAQIHRMMILANACYPDLTPALIEHAQKVLVQNDEHEDFVDDLTFIVREYKTPIKERHKETKQRLKIALCVSGQLRGWKQAFRSWQQIGLADHDITYVIHTWKDTGEVAPFPPKDVRALPPRFQRAFRSLWNELGQEMMLSRYPSFFALWPTRGSDIDVEELKRAYGTEHVFVDDDSISPFSGFTNAEKMYYKIWKCHTSAIELDDSFDLIVRIRPDLEFLENFKINWLDIYRQCSQRRLLYCESNYLACPTYFFPNIGYCMPDQFAIACPDVMNGYALAYPMSKNLPAPNRLAPDRFPRDFLAHRNVAYSTLYHGITVEGIALACRLVPAHKPTTDMINDAIRYDAMSRNDLFDELLISSL